MKTTMLIPRLLPLVLAACLSSANASLVGHWTFDEGGGTNVTDGSGFANHGTLVNLRPFTWTNGVSGGALYLDGTTGAGSTCVTIPDAASLDLTNAISVAVWVRCDDAGRDAPILDKEGDGQLAYWFGTIGAAHFGVLLDTDGNQPWSIYDRDQGLVPQGLWVHLTSTWDGTTIRHYVNGEQLPETAAFSGPIHASTAALIIGANVPYNYTAFKGTLDDLRLFNHALSVDEVRALGGTPQLMVGYWPFDEGGETNVLDHSGQANHGTIIHLQTNTWTSGIRGGALYFPGVVGQSSTYVAIPDTSLLRIVGDISFAAWVRCDDIRRDAPILAKEGDGHLSYWFGTYGLNNEGAGPGNFGMLLDPDGNQPWTMYDRDQGAVPEGQWVHLASVREGTTVRHYLNGQSLGNSGGSFTGAIHISDAFLAIGVNSLYNFAANHTAFLGALDEVRLYNYALTPAEVTALHASAVAPTLHVEQQTNNVVLSWPLPADGWVLEATNALPSVAAPWPQLPPPYQTNGGTLSVSITNTPSMENQFFRLHKP